jgi:hypothetical protein
LLQAFTDIVAMLVIRQWVFVLVTSPSLRELAPVLVKNCPNHPISKVFFFTKAARPSFGIVDDDGDKAQVFAAPLDSVGF